jgi:hypothetical protein
LTTQHFIEVVNATRLCQGGAVENGLDRWLQKEAEGIVAELKRQQAAGNRRYEALASRPFGAVGNFGESLMRANTEAVASSHSRCMAVLRQLDSALGRLDAKGQLSAEVTDEFKTFVGFAIGSILDSSSEEARRRAELLQLQEKTRKQVEEEHRQREFDALTDEQVEAEVRAIGKFFSKLYRKQPVPLSPPVPKEDWFFNRNRTVKS